MRPSRSFILSFGWVVVPAIISCVVSLENAQAQSPDPVQKLIESLTCKPGQDCNNPPSEAKDRKRGISFQTMSEASKRKIEAAAANGQAPSENVELLFDFNSTEIKGETARRLDNLGRALNDSAVARNQFVLIGHTDGKGGAQYNQILSEKRAASVREYLIRNHKIDPDRLRSYGRGKTSLKNLSDPFASENRRVQIVNRATMDSTTQSN